MSRNSLTPAGGIDRHRVVRALHDWRFIHRQPAIRVVEPLNALEHIVVRIIRGPGYDRVDAALSDSMTGGGVTEYRRDRGPGAADAQFVKGQCCRRVGAVFCRKVNWSITEISVPVTPAVRVGAGGGGLRRSWLGRD